VAIEEPLFISNARQMAEIALQSGMPMIGFRPQADAGALMDYGVDVVDFPLGGIRGQDIEGHPAGRPPN
jgi:hypothetical protein